MEPLSADLTARDIVSEGDLWRASVGGDGEAFGRLFDLHRNRVFRHACRLTGNRQEAEDVLASAFLELWRLRDRVRLVEGSVLGWLLATTTNLALNASRARRRYQRFLERLPREERQADVAEVIDGLEIGPELRAAVRALNTKDAQLFALVALEGYPVTEAAAFIGVSVSAARARLHRVRASLRGQLAGERSALILVEREMT